MVVFLLAFSFNAYACLVPLSGTSDASMGDGCSTPIEQSARQLCDAFKTLGVESGSQSSSLLVDHHLLADHALVGLPAVSQPFHGLLHQYHLLDMGSPPHQSLQSIVLRI
jgi:hypothetical protein